MDTATVIVTALLAVLFTFSASIKLLGVQKSLAIRDHLGVSRFSGGSSARANWPVSQAYLSG